MFKAIMKVFGSSTNTKANPSMVGASDFYSPPKWYPWEWWQMDLDTDTVSTNTTVEACVATISQTVSMLPISHVRINEDGGRTILTNSAAYRVLRKPNPFQTKSEFLVDILRRMLLTGNGFGVCTRNNRYEIDAIYPQYQMSPYITNDSKEVYYSFSDNILIDLDSMIPARDVLHLKMHTNQHPLRGETPLSAAVLSGATGTSIQGHTNRFFANMSRPSGVLQTDMSLTAEQTKALRERFESLSRDVNAGGTPILTNGLKYAPITMSAVDSEIIATYNMTVRDIASIYRIPLSLIGQNTEKSTASSTEDLMRFWVSTGLGFIIEHLENSLEALFNLPANERIEFDTEFILSADIKSRFEAYKIGVTAGVISPNEVRSREKLKPLGGGDTLYMQMQNVPLELTGKKLQADIEKVEQEVECGKDCGVVEEILPIEETSPAEESAIDENKEVSIEDAMYIAEHIFKLKRIEL